MNTVKQESSRGKRALTAVRTAYVPRPAWQTEPTRLRLAITNSTGRPSTTTDSRIWSIAHTTRQDVVHSAGSRSVSRQFVLTGALSGTYGAHEVVHLWMARHAYAYSS